MKNKYLLPLMILIATSSYGAGKCAAAVDSYSALAEAKTIMVRQASDLQGQISALQQDCVELNRRLAIKQQFLNQAYRELGNLQRSIREVDARI
ncbi:MAG TPA: hypothetical protein V6C97_35190 [Oculatellaceae cyanobacterium]